jgi:hypothetical protein
MIYFRALFAYICFNIVLLSKLDMVSSHNFDDTINQSHDFLSIYNIIFRLDLDRINVHVISKNFLRCIPQIQKPGYSIKLQVGDC